MLLRTWWVVAITLTALVLGTSFAHGLEETGHALRLVLHLTALVLLAGAVAEAHRDRSLRLGDRSDHSAVPARGAVTARTPFRLS